MPPEGFLRPKAVVLSDDSLVPSQNLIQPPPNRFTHQIVGDEPFYFASADNGGEVDGSFPEGTLVVLLRVVGDNRCRVADSRGMHVEISCNSLAELPPPDASAPGVPEPPDPPLR